MRDYYLNKIEQLGNPCNGQEFFDLLKEIKEYDFLLFEELLLDYGLQEYNEF